MSGRLPDAVRKLIELPETDRKLGAFRLKQPLGQGGFAPVWLADEVAGNAVLRQAAVKLFALDRGGEARSAIIDEAARLSRLEHPNIVRFYALPIDERLGVVGLAMEHVAGKSLAELLMERQTLPAREVIDVGIAIASTLVAIHGAGIVHRDIHTGNVMVNEAFLGSPAAYKLIDFGIASAREGSALLPTTGTPRTSQSSSPREGVGKRGYVDPVTWKDPDAPMKSASDLYALGALLFVCLIGRLPAAGQGGLDHDVLRGDKPAPRVADVAPDAPSPLAEIIDALLAPEPAQRPRSAEIVVLELERLRASLTGRRRSLPSEDEGPFRGLARFEKEHRDVFFGRRVEAASAIEVLRTRGLVALVGPSGSGKSSIARAGILPALEDSALGGARVWEQVTVSPGTDPRRALTTALFHVEMNPDASPEEAATRLETWTSEQRRGLVILIDQLEELSTLGTESDGLAESRKWTKDFLAKLVETPRPGLRVIVTARQDLIDRILEHKALGRALMRGTVLVSPLREAAWGEVIDAALESYGYAFEDATLRRELLDSLKATADAMPLVEFALMKLWELRDRERKVITRQAWLSLGGVAGALDAHASAVAKSIEDDKRATEADIKRVTLKLITPAGARAPRTLAELTDDGRDEAAAMVAQRFEDARLFVREAGRGGRAHDLLTLAHEALIAHWGKLSTWAAEDREGRMLREDLAQAAAVWARSHDDELLWGRRRLLLAQETLKRRGVKLEGDERRFFLASMWAAWRWRIAVAAAGLLGMIALAGLLWMRQQKIMAEMREARERGKKEAAEQDLVLERTLKETAQAKEAAAAAETKLERALKEAAIAALAQVTTATKESEEARLAEREANGKHEASLAPGTVRQIEAYLGAPRRASEAIPEPFENVISEPAKDDDAQVDRSPLALEPVEPPPPSAPAPPELEVARSMPLGAAYGALRTAQAKGAACKRDGGPHGSGKLVLVIAPSGRVSSVVLERPFAGTPVGQCVAAAFEAVTVQPFEGKPVTVLWSFVVP